MIKRHPLMIFTELTFGLTWIQVEGAARRQEQVRAIDGCGPGYQQSPPSLRLRSPEAAKQCASRGAAWAMARRLVVVSVIILQPAAFSAVVAGGYLLAGGSWQAARAFFNSRSSPYGLLRCVDLDRWPPGELGWRGFA